MQVMSPLPLRRVIRNSNLDSSVITPFCCVTLRVSENWLATLRAYNRRGFPLLVLVTLSTTVITSVQIKQNISLVSLLLDAAAALFRTPTGYRCGRMQTQSPIANNGGFPYHGTKLRIKTLLILSDSSVTTPSLLSPIIFGEEGRGVGGCHYHNSSLTTPQSPLTLSLPSLWVSTIR